MMATEKTSGKKAGDALLKKRSAEERKVDGRKVEPAKAVPSLQERSDLRNVRIVPTEKARQQSSAQYQPENPDKTTVAASRQTPRCLAESIGESHGPN
jgi:hypothetical protein